MLTDHQLKILEKELSASRLYIGYYTTFISQKEAQDMEGAAEAAIIAHATVSSLIQATLIPIALGEARGYWQTEGRVLDATLDHFLTVCERESVRKAKIALLEKWDTFPQSTKEIINKYLESTGFSSN